jgi:hypothetical protein
MQIVVAATMSIAIQSCQPTMSQRLRAISWWLLPLKLVTLYLLAI